jgi:predicted nuclease of predicted toxin-antitoxin system
VRWLAYECTHGSVVTALRNAGHDVIYVAEDFPEAADIDLAEFAMNENRLVLTEDRDFGRIVFRNERAVPGIVYFRFDIEHRSQQWTKLRSVIEAFGEQLYGHCIVIEPDRFRSRPLPDN